MISVVIPALNEARALPETLDSLFAQPGSFEVILVDGGSTDDTVDVARRYCGVRVLEAPAGRAQQMNTGATVAKGEIIVFLHADTKLPNGGIELLNELELDSPASDQLPQLVATLKRFKEAAEANKSDPLVTIDANDAVPMQRVVDVLGACAVAELTNITLAASGPTGDSFEF